MVWLIFVAVILSTFTLFFLVNWCILRFGNGAKFSLNNCFGLYRGKQEVYKYVVTPSRGDQFQHGMPTMKSRSVNVQPTTENLDLRLFTMKPQTLDKCNLNIESPSEIYQTPLISNYQSNKKEDLSWMTNSRRTLGESYKQMCDANITTPIITEARTHTNVTNEEHRVTVELSFSIFYDAPTKDLHITVLYATGFPVEGLRMNSTQRENYLRVNVRVEPWETVWRATRSVRGDTEARFGETFIISGLVHHRLRECRVHFVLIDLEEDKNSWKVVGEITQTLIDCRANQLMKVTKKVLQ